jgi:predicted DNA-binding transcriptional regulator AlpA
MLKGTTAIPSFAVTMNDPAPHRRMLSVPEAAAYCGISVAYMNALRCKGGSARYIKIGSRVLYDSADLDAWLADKRRTSTSDRCEGGAK